SGIPIQQTTTKLCGHCINTSQQLQWSSQKSSDPQQQNTVPTSAPSNLPHFSTTLFNHQRTSRYV
ncbi:unnamed protein product, partial [Ceratitis capitata]